MILILTMLLGCPDCPDADDDGVCDADDICLGDDATGDPDEDGICSSDDICVGDDATGDSDDDGRCDDIDVCPLDAPDDTDGDGVCDSDDLCPLDENDDSDGDGACDSADICPGATDETDGSCTLVLAALKGPEDWGGIAEVNPAKVCPPPGGGLGLQRDDDVYAIYVDDNGGNPIEGRAALSFDTSVIPGDATVQSAQVVVNSEDFDGFPLPIELWGGTQPLFAPITDGGVEAYSAGTVVISISSGTVVTVGYASFDVASQVNRTGMTRFVMRMEASCVRDAIWYFATPQGPTDKAPTLTVEYQP